MRAEPTQTGADGVRELIRLRDDAANVIESLTIVVDHLARRLGLSVYESDKAIAEQALTEARSYVETLRGAP